MGEHAENSNQAISELSEEGKQEHYGSLAVEEAKEHRIILSAWGIPSPVNVGEVFTVKLGARCPENCPLVGTTIIVSTDKGEQIAQTRLEDKVLAGTSGTYYAELEVTAPSEEATYTWNVSCVPPETQLTFQAEALSFSFRTAAPPEHRVGVKVIASRDRIPLEMANVMLGLHRSFTNEQGAALVEVPSGKQMLRVSKQDYRSHEEEIDISSDAEFAIELMYDPAL